jgi:hypothetical protein
MDITFRIIWFEDVDEWYNTLSRRVERYIKSKNFKVDIKRVKGISDFNIQKFNIPDYDLLIVDYELEKVVVDGEERQTYGSQIINMIRSGRYVNDVLFYSSHGFEIISNVMKNEGLQGVFIADRDNVEFINMTKLLIDKAIRRTENLINIRGIVMDTTSDFDNKIKDIISILWRHLGDKEENISKDIQKKILSDNVKSATKLMEKYPSIDSKNIDELLNERDFSAYRQARLLSWCINSSEELKLKIQSIFNSHISSVNMPQEVPFFEQYKCDVIDYRNALAHVKNSPETTGEFYIGEINGSKISFDLELCNQLRKTLINYDDMLDEIYKCIEQS